MQCVNRSWISSRSMLLAMLTAECLPSGVTNWFSGEVEGAVTRWPLPSSIRKSRQNSAAPFIKG